jgi:putative flippase GtrA
VIAIGQSYLFAGSVSFVVATFVNFILSTRYVFPDRKGTGFRKIVGTYAVSAVGLCLNQLILWLAIDHFHFLPLLAKLLATGVVFFWNYFIRNYFVFRG